MGGFRDCVDKPDADARARRRARDEARRAEEDAELQAQLAGEVLRLFPGCPEERADAIARHAAAWGSGRVGRTAAARNLEPEAIERAVAAAVRHAETEYDELLMSGVDRDDARAQVSSEVSAVLDQWRQPSA